MKTKSIFCLMILCIVAMFLIAPMSAQAGWDNTGVKSEGVTYYDSNNTGNFLQTAVSGGSYTNVATNSGGVTSGWNSQSVQAGVALGFATGNGTIKQSSDGKSWYAIVDWDSTLEALLGF